MVKPYSSACQLCSASANQSVSPSLWAKHSTKSRFFAVLAPKWWKELPNDIRTAEKVYSRKSWQRWAHPWQECTIIPQMNTRKMEINPLELFPWCLWALVKELRVSQEKTGLKHKQDKNMYINTPRWLFKEPSWLNVEILGAGCYLRLSFDLNQLSCLVRIYFLFWIAIGWLCSCC